MPQPGRQSQGRKWIVAAGVLLAAAVVTLVIVMPRRPREEGRPNPSSNAMTTGGAPVSAAHEPGAAATVTGGGRTVTRILPAAAFGLGEGESLDWRIPPGRTIVQIEVTVEPRHITRAAVGAAVRHARVSIDNGGVTVAHGRAGEEPVEVWSKPQTLGAGNRRWTFTIEYDQPPAAFRALWKPDGALAAQPLPIDSVGWLRADHVSEGLSLVRDLSCAACHVAESARWRALLAPPAAPLLAGEGRRPYPADWLRRWVADPAATRPGSAMPSVSRRATEEEIEDVIHFVRSLANVEPGSARESNRVEASTDAATVQAGLVAYHRVGCVACHGPLNESPGGGPVAVPTEGEYVSLGDVGSKWTISELRQFLREPSARHPSGRMPDLMLTHAEADSIARYLIARLGSAIPAETPVEPERAVRGRDAFASMGCAACHVVEARVGGASVGDHFAAAVVRSTLVAPSMEQVAAAPDGGCLAESGDHAGVHYDLSWRDRRAIRAFLDVMATVEGGDASSPRTAVFPVPGDELAAALRSLNCLACHEFHDAGGPEPAIVRYFSTAAPGDLGLEGRLPPDLSHAGARLTESWLREVLLEHQRARPWLHARMPRYDADRVARLPELFRTASGVDAMRSVAPPMPSDEQIAIGRQLVGVGGLNCISCHAIAGRPSTGTPGPDLARMTDRLRFEHFVTWLLDPRAVRPDTRMPSFFVGGQSAAIGFYEGDPLKQVEAIWAYLSQGAALTLPDGLPPVSAFQMSATDEPVVVRMSLPAGGGAGAGGVAGSVGARVVLLGFPENVHLAFDPDRARLMYVWEGEFIDAAGRWAARAGQAASDPPPGWNAPLGPVLVVGEPVPHDWLTRPSGARFAGYRLDAQRHPILLWEVGSGDALYRVEERPTPQRSGAPGLRRHFVVTGPPGGVVHLNVGAGQRVEEVVRGNIKPADASGLARATMDEAGRLDVVVEVRW